MWKSTTRAVTAGVLGLAMAGTSAQADEIEIGWTAWSDAEFITKLAARVIEDEMNYDVNLTQTDIAPQYQGLAGGSIDLMLMSWLPDTHADYWAEVQDDVVDLGVLYDGARLGWAVPTYIPEDQVSSIADLQDDEVRERLDGTITGIDPGAGLSSLSENALEDYGLDGYRIEFSSGAGMTAALDRAYGREDWIVVTGWSPHWKFGAYELRYLEDPEGSLGAEERIHALGRMGFDDDHPEVADFVSAIHIDLELLQDYMFEAEETSYEDAVTKFIDENPELIQEWLEG